ncbi:ATP synthase F1 subunit delta [Gleimia hominis]|uniref:ATP synthase subunit delta n=1 Tax=Gleimia hominis TaxID=595468 RepID=A0ABU3IAK0_9ACTO|nr:ATP synthase F1 subunit delta [Gleimia hominis]MDT3767404.1 ATP synthase F1 subunit delta [Gleimia hominis]
MRASSAQTLHAATRTLRTVFAQEHVDAMAAAENLFGLSDLARKSRRVRGAISDPSRSGEDKEAFVQNLLRGGVQDATVKIAQTLARGTWSSADDVADVFELLGMQAVLEAAVLAGALEQTQKELHQVQALLVDERELRNALSDLGVGSAHDRAHFAARLLDGHVNQYTSRLVRRAVRLSVHGRLTARLHHIIDLAANRQKQRVAEVTVARPLSAQQQTRLQSILERKHGGSVTLNVMVDPDLMGGMRIVMGSEAVNATVRSEIRQAQRAMVGK